MGTIHRPRGFLFIAAALLVIAGHVAGQDPVAAQRFLAGVPARLLAGAPAGTADQYIRGQISTRELLGRVGLASTLQRAAPSPLEAKQFITHWLSHDVCLVGGVNDDLVSEATIDGRCSGLKLADGAAAPTTTPTYWPSEDGSVITTYMNAPFDEASCTHTYSNLTRYFVTWVKSPFSRVAKVFVGAADGFKLWVNGVPVLQQTSGGSKPWTVDEYKATATLVMGWNLLVFKHSFVQLGPLLDPANAVKLFSLRFAVDDAGTPITNLIAAFDPKCTESDAGGTATRVVIPNIAHLVGAGLSQWRTDITLGNCQHMSWQYRLRYYREGNNSGVPESDQLLELAPFQVKTWGDVLPGLLGVGSDQKGYGVVLQQVHTMLTYFTSRWIQAKVYNQGSAGTFGMAVPVQQGDCSGVRGGAVVFYGLRNGVYRSNFGMVPEVNAGASARVRLTLYGGGIPAPLIKEYAGITGYWQLNNVFKDMGVPLAFTSEAILVLELLDNPTGTAWLPYVTVNDGNPATGSAGTSDPIFLLDSPSLVVPGELR